MTAEYAIRFLMDRFPMLTQRVDGRDDLLVGSHFAFSLLATETIERQADESFLDRVGEFMDDLAESDDILLEEVLVVDVLEGLAQDSDLAQKMRKRIHGRAAAWLDQVERELYGRDI